MENLTAVEWLDDEMWKLRLLFRSGDISIPLYFQKEEKLFEQAKQMEKQQLIDAHTIGYVIGGGNGDLYDCKQYIEETYGK